jgi:hypothetical protein
LAPLTGTPGTRPAGRYRGLKEQQSVRLPGHHLQLQISSCERTLPPTGAADESQRSPVQEARSSITRAALDADLIALTFS